jgi:hypothetical protein
VHLPLPKWKNRQMIFHFKYIMGFVLVSGLIFRPLFYFCGIWNHAI